MNKTTCRYLLAFLLSFCALHLKAQVKKPFGISSPDKSTRMEVGISPAGELQYRVLFDQEEVLTWSPLGFQVNGLDVGKQSRVLQAKRRRKTERFPWPLGENEVVDNSYRELELVLQSGSLPYTLQVRVFDGSVAFRYGLPPGLENALVQKENTRFNFTASHTIYQYHHESVFTPVNVNSLVKACDFPATLTNGIHYISVGEAHNEDFTKAELVKGSAPNSLAVAFLRDKEVRVPASFQMPWRTVSFSHTAIGLHRHSELYLKLSPPAAAGIAAAAWVQPGKLMRAQLNTQSGLDCIDLAARLHFSYIMFDAGWYGPERAVSSDPRVVIPAIDLPRVVQYGKEKGIGVILYVNYVGLRNHLDELLPLYKQWGISGLKFGFIDGFSQQGITWLTQAIKKVQDAGLVLNIHDNLKPTGLSRTYPALLTQEGIRGDENSPDAFHNTTLPFTRFLAGAGDFTYCFPNPRNSFSKNIKVSKAQQLALTVVYFSPLQAIFWYGQPLDYTNEHEIEFFKYVPTVWHESHYLAGQIGENISVARRQGQTWFVGSAAGLQDWQSTIRLDFLKKGITYKATVFEDDGAGSIRKRSLEVKKGDTFALDIKARGGQALMIEAQGKR